MERDFHHLLGTIHTIMRQIYLLSCLFSFIQGSIVFYLALQLNEMHFDGWRIGILLTLYTLTPLILSVPAGVLNDRISSRVLIACSLGGYGLFFVGLALVKTFIPLLFIFFLGGAAANFFKISLQTLALKITGDTDKGEKLGKFNGFSSMCYSAGLFAGGYLRWSGVLGEMLIYSAIVQFTLMLYSLRLQETTLVNINLLEYIKDFRQKNVLYFCLVYSVFAFHWGSEVSSLSLFLRDYFHLSKLQSAIYMCIPVFGLGIASLFSGFLVDRGYVNTRRSFILAFMASAFGQFFMLVPSASASLAVRVIHDIGDGIASLCFLVSLRKMFKVERIGGLSSLVMLATVISSSTGMLVFSRIGEAYGYQYSITGGGIAIVLAIMLLLIHREDM